LPKRRRSALHSPLRRCAACRRTAPKHTLLRFARLPWSHQVVFDTDQRLPGRGAYLCPRVDCCQRALKRKSLERALKTSVGAGILETVIANLSPKG